jgi:hypothetical protein
MGWSITDGDIYVDGVNGNDISGDGTINNPYASIQKSFDSMPAATPTTVFKIIVAAGVYEEILFWNAEVGSLGGITDYIFTLEGDGVVVLDGKSIDPERNSIGFRGSQSSAANGNNSFTVKNFQIQNFGVLWDSGGAALPTYGWKADNCHFIGDPTSLIGYDIRSYYTTFRFCTFRKLRYYGHNVVYQSIFINCNFRNVIFRGTAVSPTLWINCDADSDSDFFENNSVSPQFKNCNIRAQSTQGGTPDLSSNDTISVDPLYNLVNEDDYTYQSGSPNLNAGTFNSNIGAKGYAPVAAGSGGPLTLAGGATLTNVIESGGTFFLSDPNTLGTIESANIDLSIQRTVGKINFLGGDDFDIYRLDSQAGATSSYPHLYSYELKWGDDEVSMVAANYYHMKINAIPRWAGSFGNGDENFVAPGNAIKARWLKVKITINP